ncbi:MAG: AAA family ATPase [Verrucomicrobiales bacterium]|nr:AAA family ATPase [Verrucomicrobiales bacterium]
MNRTINIVNLDTGNEMALPIASAPLTGTLTQEMLQWLTDNREDYEFYMLHAMLHDPLRRLNLLSVPVTPDDFRREEYALVIRAITVASKVMGMIGQSLPNPPTVEFLRTYVDCAAKEEASDDEVIDDTMKLLKELQDPSFGAQHYCVEPYFEAWYGSARAKKAARELQKVDIPDVRGILEKLEITLAAASALSGTIAPIKFDFDSPPDPPEPILKLGEYIIGTPGNIVNIQGPPKSAKSAVICATIAATLASQGSQADTLGITAISPEGRAVVHFDTEQSDHAHYALLRRAYSRAHQHEEANWLHSYCLTSKDPAMCWSILLSKCKALSAAHGGIMLIVLDGIADFCNDPNNSEESFGIVRRLHKLAMHYECVVLTVLHENPGSTAGKTRGHLGSQLERKAETSLRLRKDAKTGITVMWADSARHCFIPQGAGWRFRWCDQTKMHVSLHEGGRAYGEVKPDKNEKYAVEVSSAFEKHETLSYAALIDRIMEVTGHARSTAKSRIREYVECALIEKDPSGIYLFIRDHHLERPVGQSATTTEITSLS